MHLLSHTDYPKPALVVLAGFCWGNLKIVKSDSVIAATEICALNEKREKVGETQYVPHRHYSILKIDTSMIAEINEKLAPMRIEVLSGPLASLEIRYEANAARDALLEKFSDLYGGEMEAFGIIPSCSLPWVVLKAVSDSGGDDFGTIGQKAAANRAAETITHLVSVLESNEVLPAATSGPTHDFLADILSGDTISVTADSISREGLNDYLDGIIGPRIEYKLRSYSSDLEYGPDFARIFCDLLLELMQNSIRHGGAKQASVKFFPSKIIFTDDGSSFQPGDLIGDKGGARAWREAVIQYNADDMITVKHKKDRFCCNIYTFALGKAAKLLNEARVNCQVNIKPNSIGLEHGSPDILSFDKACGALYFDASNVRMMPRRLSALSALRSLAKSGKKIFVACSSSNDANFYRQEFRDLAGDQVVIFVK